MSSPVFDGPQVRRILLLAAPVILAMLTQTGVNIVDTYFLGKLDPDAASAAQAALTPSLMLLWAIGGFLSSIGVGTQALVSRRFGEGDKPSAGTVVPNAVVITLAGGIVLSVLGWIAMPWLFSHLVKTPTVAALGTTYCRWRFVGITSMAATAAYKAFFDGIGKTQRHLVAAIAMNIVNGVLCWVLIFGNLGAPVMGIAGAGIAAAVASWLGLVVMWLFTFGPTIRRDYRIGWVGKMSRPLVSDLLRLSVPGGIATVVVMTGFLAFTRIVSQLDGAAAYGTHAPNGAATTIIIEVLSATFFSCIAFGTATATLVGQNLGAGKPDTASDYAWTSVKLGVLIFSAIGLVIFLFAPQVLGLFTHEHDVIAVGTAPLRLVSALGGVIAIGMILTQALFGAGDTRYVMMVEMGLHFGCLVPLAFVLGVVFKLGLVGIFSAVGAYAVGLAALMALRFSKGAWRRVKI